MSKKRLRSVAHSIGHHGMSALSFLHPHLAEVCRAAGVRTARIDLLFGSLESPEISVPQPLALAISALSNRFSQILSSEGIDRTQLVHAIIEFRISPEDKYGWPYKCYIRLQTLDGDLVEDAIGPDFRRAEILRDTT